MMLGAAKRRMEGDKKKETGVERKDLEQIEEDNKNPDVHGMVHSYYYQFAHDKD